MQREHCDVCDGLPAKRDNRHRIVIAGHALVVDVFVQDEAGKMQALCGDCVRRLVSALRHNVEAH